MSLQLESSLCLVATTTDIQKEQSKNAGIELWKLGLCGWTRSLEMLQLLF